AEELAAAVPDPEDLAFLHRQFGTDGPPNFEERRFILVRRTPLDTADAPRLQRLRITLLAARERRPRPNVDTKVLTSWNGLTIAGLASAGHALKDAMLIARAKRAAEFLLKTVKTDDGRLFHVYAAAPGEPAKPQVPGYLDDYTHLVHGLLALHDATGQERWLASAGELTDAMIARFHDEQSGGFFFTTADHDALFVRLKDQHDGVQLSGNGQAVLNLIQLWKKTGNERYRELANRSLNTFAGAMQSDPVGLTGMVRAIGLLDDRLK
ncbi:MAG TPA: hypothetical protein VM165_21680, partial [Planctomycetaceae bacterium]|nr:hypothetical protein [Planctomycetaceae bacterium]